MYRNFEADKFLTYALDVDIYHFKRPILKTTVKDFFKLSLATVSLKIQQIIFSR